MDAGRADTTTPSNDYDNSLEMAEEVMDDGLPDHLLVPSPPAAPTPVIRRRLTLSRKSGSLSLNWNGGQEGGSCSIDQERLSQGADDNDSYTRTSLYNSLRSIRKSLGTADDKIRTFVRDYFLYKLTLTSAYVAFSLMFGIILACLLHFKLYGRTGGLQPNYDLPMNSSGRANIKDLQKLGKLYMDLELEYQVDLQCGHYRKEWEASLELRLKNAQCSQRVEMLEDEISSLRHQFTDKLTQNQHDLNRLIQAVKNFRQEHFFFRKSSVYQVCIFVWNFCLWGGILSYIVYRVHVHYYKN